MVLENDEDLMDWKEKMPNEEMLAKIGMKRQQINTIKKMQWGFIAHEFRREGGIERRL